MVRINYTITSHSIDLEDQFRSILEHLRYSGSRVNEWEITDGKLKIKAIFRGTITHWRQAKLRSRSFVVSIENEQRYSESETYIPRKTDADQIRQCLKCQHIWKPQSHLRQSGHIALRCPKCNSNQTMDGHLIRTKVWRREDLLIFTDDQYPAKFCPRTSLEEIKGVQVTKEGDAKIIIGRGFENPKYGHKVVLVTKRGHVMDTNYKERQSMKGAVAWCPKSARVFIGGLGLGLILIYLAKTKKAKEVVVCEIDQDVINLVEPKLRKWFTQKYPDFNWRVIHGDALQEVKKGEPYDWVFLDIWKTAQDIKLMKRAEEAGKENLTKRGKVTCWMKSTYEKKQRRYRTWEKKRRGV